MPRYTRRLRRPALALITLAAFAAATVAAIAYPSGPIRGLAASLGTAAMSWLG